LQRLTFIYLATYLVVGGLGLLVVPGLTLRLLLSRGGYGDVMPRLVGVFMIALGGAVFEFVRARDYSYYRYAFIRSPRRRGRASNRPPGAAADFVTGIKPAYSPALAWPEGGRCPSLASATVRGTATSRQVLRVQETCRGHAATARV
jgi:hypothetical protein